MKSRLGLVSLITILLITTCGPCLALIGLMPVSKEKAKELGMEIRLQGNGTNDIWVEFELKPDSKLKEFMQVSLEIGEGEKLLVGNAILRERRSASGSILVTFMANRAFLDKISLRVVAGPGGFRTGYDLRLKDFVEPVKNQ